MSRPFLILLLTTLLAAPAVGCGALVAEDMEGVSAGTGGFGAASGSSSGTGLDGGVDVEIGQDGGPTPISYAELCGGGCVPVTGESAPCDLGEGGSGGGGSAPTGGAGGSGGAAGGSGDGLEVECQLAVEEDGSVNGVCGSAGTSEAGASCLGASDCAAGLGCVSPGVCRPYCCGHLEACPSKTFCQPVPAATADVPQGAGTVEIPVCVPASECTLLEDSTCPPGETCTIVRVDGTTSCVTPGSNELGQPCPCAAGYVCSSGADQCFKLCKIAEPECPPNYTCQGGSTGYPEGFGICIAN